MKKVLVTGGAGYLGSVLCRRLLKIGYKVRVLDKLLYGDSGIEELYKDKNFEFINGDIRNISTVADSIKGVDSVIHLAAIVNDPSSSLYPNKTMEINYFATKFIAEICKYYGINRFIFASTCSVFGASTSEKLLIESSATNPVSVYGKSKLLAENAILNLTDENFSPTVLRMATLHGVSPRMRFDLAVNLMTAQAKYEGKYNIFGGDQWRAFCHIDDAVSAYIMCLEAPIKDIKGELINVCTENMTILDLGEKIRDIVPLSEINIDKKNVDKRNYRVSNKKIKGIFNFKLTRSIEDSIREIWNSDYTNFRYPIYDNYEVLKRKEID